MMNKKENLIATLRGSIETLKDFSASFEGCDIYDDTGHVDLVFFETVLRLLTAFKKAEVDVSQSFIRLLCPDMDSADNVIRESESGKHLAVEEVLKQCVFKDNTLYLPKVQLAKKTYADVKLWIEEAGGNWTGGKVQGFRFDFDATRVAGILMQGKRCNLAQEFQFFETPTEVADWLVSLVGEIKPGCSVLEPSAGRGAIVKAIHRAQPEVVVDCYELMPENKQLLSRLEGVRIVGDDFTKEEYPGEYDYIIANPPFNKNQDVRHTKQMYAWLKPGGTVAVITSPHWRQASEKLCKDFRKWLDEVEAQIFEIGEGAFKKSGTNVNTIAIVITKK